MSDTPSTTTMTGHGDSHSRPRQSVLFASRGKGRGHAVPDVAIADALQRVVPTADVTFVSYSTGALTLSRMGKHVVDLGLAEDPPLWDSVHAFARVLGHAEPDLVISHEEFSALPLAHARGAPVVFLTDWFLPEDAVVMQSLRWADEIVFMDRRGLYDEPRYLAHKVTYAGCVVRPLGLGCRGRANARASLGIGADCTLAIVAPGGATIHSERAAPLCELLAGAFELLDCPRKHLLWISADGDYEGIRDRFLGRCDVTVMAPHQSFLETLSAGDVIVTKGNRNTLFECEAMGLPTVSVSFGLNPIDDARAVHIKSNVALRARGLTPAFLASVLSEAITLAPLLVPRDERILRQPLEVVAQRLSHWLEPHARLLS